jgi:DnaJ-class molecular chaperone
LKLHPDKNKEKDATQAFNKISKAYTCLINPDKRSYYDSCGTDDYDDRNRAYE